MAIVSPEATSQSSNKGVFLSKKLCILLSILVFLVLTGIILGLSLGLSSKSKIERNNNSNENGNLNYESCRNLSCSILEGNYVC